MAALGIDTSCYTTSVAVSQDGRIISDLRKKLDVADGGLGLRQSDALFAHVKNLPGLIDSAFKEVRVQGFEIDSVAASAWPRRAEGSYMPVFKAGLAHASAIASSLGLKLSEVSHQEGHIAACAPGAGLSPGDRFLSVHVSGGTTEILDVSWQDDAMQIDILAATTDISAGQMVDRIGSHLGLPFPAGPHLEKLALQGDGKSFRLPSSTAPGKISFSGPCEAAVRGLKGGQEPGSVARAAFDCIAKSLIKTVSFAAEGTGLGTVLVVGGVASNGIIRAELSRKLPERGIEVLFGEPALSSDNAVGVSYLGELWA